jgi:nucleotide-binding universal stress UspA family protein
MSYKLIVLNLDEENAVAPLVKMAAALGEEFKTHIVGVHSLPLVDQPTSLVHYLPPDVFEKLNDSNLARAEKIKSTFERVMNALNMASEWVLHRGLGTGGTRNLIDHVRTSDLVIVSQNSQEKMPWLQRELLQKTATPMMVVPSGGVDEFNAKNISIAWNGSMQTVRAIRDSMELLIQAVDVRLVCVGGESKDNPGQIAGSDAATWLSHHGVNITLDEHPEKHLKAGISIINAIEESGADLLVMGGYGHSPLYDVVVGGVTDDVLANAEIPVFLSH